MWRTGAGCHLQVMKPHTLDRLKRARDLGADLSPFEVPVRSYHGTDSLVHFFHLCQQDWRHGRRLVEGALVRVMDLPSEKVCRGCFDVGMSRETVMADKLARAKTIGAVALKADALEARMQGLGGVAAARAAMDVRNWLSNELHLHSSHPELDVAAARLLERLENLLEEAEARIDDDASREALRRKVAVAGIGRPRRGRAGPPEAPEWVRDELSQPERTYLSLFAAWAPKAEAGLGWEETCAGLTTGLERMQPGVEDARSVVERLVTLWDALLQANLVETDEVVAVLRDPGACRTDDVGSAARLYSSGRRGRENLVLTLPAHAYTWLRGKVDAEKDLHLLGSAREVDPRLAETAALLWEPSEWRSQMRDFNQAVAAAEAILA